MVYDDNFRMFLCSFFLITLPLCPISNYLWYFHRFLKIIYSYISKHEIFPLIFPNGHLLHNFLDTIFHETIYSGNLYLSCIVIRNILIPNFFYKNCITVHDVHTVPKLLMMDISPESRELVIRILDSLSKMNSNRFLVSNMRYKKLKNHHFHP